MTPDRSLRGHLIAMLVGAAFLVLAQLGTWPPETGFERALTGLTIAAVLIAVSLTAYELRQGRRRRGRGSQP
ncbi:hypothetical protein [Kocuria rosea]|uniref:Uncharacterized protein n=1 Tax=Kocuria rosea TaxID=1275 RepID=A0A4R5Y5K4_KOCRO|nr:hypothetical protein [Kocuria rosea]TDL38575.1 hypothetical protein E2R59_16845 [Kocuria rosea]